MLASLICGVLFEAWRRARKRIWQLHLRDLCGVTLVVSVVAAWYVHQQNRYAAQERTFDSPDIGLGPNLWAEHQEGGVTWLRIMFGEPTFEFLDQPLSVSVYGGWTKLPQLTSAREVHIPFRSTTEELGYLAKMPQLEALNLNDDLEAPADMIVAELPPLPRLRGLFLCQPVNRCRRIDRLASLEALRITGEVDDQTIREIAALRNLRQLRLDTLPESTDLMFLRLLPRLSAVDFSGHTLSAAAIQNIGQCRSLKVVSFYMSKVEGGTIRHLSKLENLEDLDLSYCEVTSQDIAPLGVLERLRILNLTETQVGDLRFAATLKSLETLSLYDTEVTGEDLAPLVPLKKLHSLDLGYAPVGMEGLEYLRQIKQLKWLCISGVDRDEEESFQAALPECAIIFH
ncbi:MAG TPA: hypothetical protein VMP01_17870 [Pirellulaceae bacterium]|nr:hypothetical protein [Pirellulaceae bacterium]